MIHHAWRGWYFIPTDNLAAALRDAKDEAHKDHADTPLAAMMTPSIRRVPDGTRVFVVGRALDLEAGE